MTRVTQDAEVPETLTAKDRTHVKRYRPRFKIETLGLLLITSSKNEACLVET